MSSLIIYILISMSSCANDNTNYDFFGFHFKITDRGLNEDHVLLFYPGTGSLKSLFKSDENSINNLIYNNKFELKPENVYFEYYSKTQNLIWITVFFESRPQTPNSKVALYINLKDSGLKVNWTIIELIYYYNPKLLIKLLSALYYDYDIIFAYSTAPKIIEYKE